MTGFPPVIYGLYCPSAQSIKSSLTAVRVVLLVTQLKYVWNRQRLLRILYDAPRTQPVYLSGPKRPTTFLLGLHLLGSL